MGNSSEIPRGIHVSASNLSILYFTYRADEADGWCPYNVPVALRALAVLVGILSSTSTTLQYNILGEVPSIGEGLAYALLRLIRYGLYSKTVGCRKGFHLHLETYSC